MREQGNDTRNEEIQILKLVGHTCLNMMLNLANCVSSSSLLFCLFVCCCFFVSSLPTAVKIKTEMSKKNMETKNLFSFVSG